MVGALDRRARRARIRTAVTFVAVVVGALVVGPIGIVSSVDGDPEGAASVDRPAPPDRRTIDVGPVVYGAADQGVERLYLAYFLRDPDEGGLSYWNELRATGFPLAAISDHFAGSAEFQERYGARSDRDFVALVYENVLSRSPDADGYAYWLDRLAVDTTRGSLMVGFSESDEFKAIHQQRLRDREASAGEDTGDTTAIQLGPDGLPTAPDGHYVFALHRDDGEPYRWAPCATVGVVANFTDAPDGAHDALVTALAELSSAMRIAWRYEGTTDERAGSARPLDRPYADPDRYGDRYSPVLVSWPADWSDGGSSIGFGGFASAWEAGEDPHVVTGWVTLDRGWRPPSQGALVSLLLHELGHVANLAHVAHPEEVMHSSGVGHVTYQQGDRAGLARLGAWDADCPS